MCSLLRYGSLVNKVYGLYLKLHTRRKIRKYFNTSDVDIKWFVHTYLGEYFSVNGQGRSRKKTLNIENETKTKRHCSKNE